MKKVKFLVITKFRCGCRWLLMVTVYTAKADIVDFTGGVRYLSITIGGVIFGNP